MKKDVENLDVESIIINDFKTSKSFETEFKHVLQ